jgi:hypothetical protein
VLNKEQDLRDLEVIVLLIGEMVWLKKIRVAVE